MSNTCSQYFWKDHDIAMTLEFYHVLSPCLRNCSLMSSTPVVGCFAKSLFTGQTASTKQFDDLPVRRSCSSNLSCGTGKLLQLQLAPPGTWGIWIPVRIVPWHPFNHIMGNDPPSHHTAPLAMCTHGFGDGGNGRPLLQIVTIVIGLIIRCDLICI